MQKTVSIPGWVNVLRWSVRGWSVFVLLVAIAIAITPEADAIAGETTEIPLIEAIALGGYGLAVLGLVLGWGLETWGGALAILGVLIHDTLFYIAKGFQPEWLAGNLIVGTLFIVPAVLYILCWIFSHRNVTPGTH